MRAVAFIALCLAAPASGALVRVDLEARAPVAAEQARDGLALVAQCVAPDCVLEVKRLAPARVRASFRVAAGHSSRATICRWGANGRTIFSAGDRDGAVLQWDVVPVFGADVDIKTL